MHRSRLHDRCVQRGMTLLELLVAMTIGLFIIGGTFAVFISASDSRRTNEDISRMQENARYALTTIKPDLRLAGYWGLTRELGIIDGYAGSATQLAAMPLGDCAARWYIDLANAVVASNDTNPYSATCIPAAEYLDDTDVLVVRHASTVASATLTDGIMYIRSDAGRGEIFDGGTAPTGSYSAAAENHRLIVHAYYIRPYTFETGDNLPSLRRLTLDASGGNPVLASEEVIPGIEDLQVQYGLDTDGDGSINNYVHPGAVAAGSEILALRLWIMSRAPTTEVGYTDTNTYTYASKTFTPNDDYRRLLVTATIQLRNLMPVSTP